MLKGLIKMAAKKKQRKRKAKKVLLFLLFSALVTGIVLSLTVFFKIETVTSDGSLLYSQEEIINSCKENVYGKNIFLLNKDKILKDLQKKLPFVESITLKRSLSGSIHINVTDAVEYFSFLYDGKYYSASEKGIILADYASAPGGMIEISAEIKTPLVPGETVVYKNKTEYNDIFLLLNSLKEANINVTKIDVTNPVEETVTVENRLTVNFGGISYIDGKVAHLSGMIKNMSSEKRGKINLSVWTPSNHQSYFTEINTS